MPLGILSLAALPENSSISIYQQKYRLINSEGYQNTVNDILNKNPELVGFSTWCVSYPSSVILAEKLKKKKPDIPLIFGGPQASVSAKETMETFQFIDFIIAGEAEISFITFIREFNKDVPNYSKVPGLYFHNSAGKIIKNNPSNEIADLDKLPVPAYHLFPNQKSIKLDVGRGCPFHCTFCSTNDFFSKKYRVKSVDRIIKEMMHVYRVLETNLFSFSHDMFTLNKKFILDLCQKLIKLKEKEIHFTWTCSARIDCITEEMVVQMKKAGCQSMFFGIETGSAKIQKTIQKNLDVTKAFELVELFRKLNLGMYVSFIIGFPEETTDDLEKTLHTILKLAVKGAYVQSSELSLLPGTPLFDKYKEQLKFDGNFSNFSFTFCGEKEIKLIKQYPRIFSSFYYLPVKPLDRDIILLLNQLVNKLSLFRNTLFILSESIEEDIYKTHILSLFLSEYRHIRKEKYENKMIVSHLLRIIRKYIEYRNPELNNPYFHDIFNYDSYKALLQTLYSGWQLAYGSKGNDLVTENTILKPTPVWRILKTSYKLEKTLPSENGWRKNKLQSRRGTYRYLIVAVTEKDSKRIQIKEKEMILFDNLSQLPVSEFVKRIMEANYSKKSIYNWLKKIKELGVIEFINT